jgi:DNA replication protein DnaC
MADDDSLEFKLPDVEFDDDGDVCPKCFGAGVIVVEEGGVRYAKPCDCLRDRRTQRFAALRVPSRYQHCTLDNFALAEGQSDPSLVAAHRLARRFVDRYPAVEAGLLFMGPFGIGKTHLAFGILQELVLTKNVTCRWCDFSELLAEIKRGYAGNAFDEHAVLHPLVDAEILMIDDLGSMKIRDWTLDLLSYVINQRYINKRLVIATTNFLDEPSSAYEVLGEFARKDETLSDRIGPRLRSRLLEMCKTVLMQGGDWRQEKTQPNLLRHI